VKALARSLAAVAATIALAACGGDEAAQREDAPQAPPGEYGALKSYLLEHTARLQADTGRMRADAEAYYGLAREANFDYGRLVRERGDEVQAVVERLQGSFRRANPSYEEMEGVVAGVPELADYDVILDAGGDSSDPETAVPFNVRTPAGKTYRQPGNFFFLIESSTFGTEPRFAAKGAQPDLDGNGRTEFGEALPDADFLVAAARDFERNARELDGAARRWTPKREDVFNALVVMTPTMSEYFEAWKNSRFVAGDKATEKAFVATSRLSDIADILSGLEVVYASARPEMEKASRAQADQTGRSLEELNAFAARLRDAEAGGRRFTPAQAESLGTDAQEQAEGIAGQVSQAAGKLGIKLEES